MRLIAPQLPGQAVRVDGPGTPRVWLATGGDRASLHEQLTALASARATPGQFTSRSYAPPYAVQALHDGPVGVDLEQVSAVPAGFLDSVSTPDERRARPDGAVEARAAVLVWSAKEAAAKALGDALRYDPSRLASPTLWPDGRAGRWRYAELDAPLGHVLTLVWAPGTEPTPGGRPPAVAASTRVTRPAG